MNIPIFARTTSTIVEHIGFIASDLIKSFIVAEEVSAQPFKYVIACKTATDKIYVCDSTLFNTVAEANAQIPDVMLKYKPQL